MSHTDRTKQPTADDLVLLRFAVPAKMARSTQSEVFIITCAESVIRIPKSLLKEQHAEHLLFEARLPRDVAAAVRSLYGELFRLTTRA